MLILNNLIGFGAAPPSAAGLTLTMVASATSTGETIGAPATIVAGDLLVLWDFARNTVGTPDTTIPSGFTSIASSSGSVSVAALSSKLANGSEASATLTGCVGDAATGKALYVFRGSTVLTSRTSADPEIEVTNNNPTAKTVGASGGVAPLVVIGGYASSGTVDPRTFTVGGVGAKDGEINPSTSVYLAYKIYNTAPADVVVDMDDEGNGNSIATCYIQCS